MNAAVEVKIPTVLRAEVGGSSTVSTHGTTIAEVFGKLIAEHPGLSRMLGGDGALHKFVNVYRNDDDIRYIGGLETPVADGDVISIIPAAAGGT